MRLYLLVLDHVGILSNILILHLVVQELNTHALLVRGLAVSMLVRSFFATRKPRYHQCGLPLPSDLERMYTQKGGVCHQGLRRVE